MIIAGTIIGAGMLANPTATSGVWFAGSLVVLLYTWFSMLSSGLMILEVNTHYPHGASFDTMVKDLLGPAWNVINGIAVAFVLYLLTYAYIFVGGDLTAKGIGSAVGGEISLTVGQLVFFGILAFCVWASARLVDRFTSILIGGMVLTFIWATGGLIADAKMPILFDTQAPAGTSYWIYVATALPVCLASFGFHGNVSSLLKYFKGDAPKVAKSLWSGTLIALVIYVLWQIAIQGNLPRSSSPGYRRRRPSFRPDRNAVQVRPNRQYGQSVDPVLLHGDRNVLPRRNARPVRLHCRHLQMERQHLRPHQNRRTDLPAAFDFLPALPYRLRYRHRLRRPSRNHLDRHHPRHAALPLAP